MISTRSVELVIDTVVCLTLAKWETVSGQFGGYLSVHIAPVSNSLRVLSCYGFFQLGTVGRGLHSNVITDLLHTRRAVSRAYTPKQAHIHHSLLGPRK